MSFMESNLVSIIMPAYNGERFIKQAIESVLAQMHFNWELIVVDDGSTDGTAQMVSSFKDQRIIYTYQENCGQAAALNRGLDIARGEYITTLDVDDWFTSNSLCDRAEFLDNHPRYDVVYGDGIFCDLDGNQLKRFSELRIGEVIGDVFGVLLSNAFYGTGANVMVRKRAIEKYNIRYDETIVWCQDYDFYLQLAEKCHFGYVDSLIVWYRLHRANMTMTMPTDRRNESLVKVKLKTLSLPGFEKLQNQYRYLFFQNFLLYDLFNRVEDQKALLAHQGFLHLPKHDQARVIRLVASGYLSVNKNIEEVRLLLIKSWKLNPLDLKTLFVMFLVHFRSGPVAPLFRYWQKVKLHNSFSPSVFEHLREIKK